MGTLQCRQELAVQKAWLGVLELVRDISGQPELENGEEPEVSVTMQKNEGMNNGSHKDLDRWHRE